MLRLSLTLLTGRYVATAYNDRRVAEWPPHPARIYSALVAAHYDTDAPDPAERSALEWLATIQPPCVVATDAEARKVLGVYVPTNDAEALQSIDKYLIKLADAEEELRRLKAHENPSTLTKEGERKVKQAERALDKSRKSLKDAQERSSAADGRTLKGDPPPEVLPTFRSRQGRTFPSVAPQSPNIDLVWDETPEGDVIEALNHLARRISRIGHSASLVTATFTLDPMPEEDDREWWKPDATGSQMLRVPMAGLLGRLDEFHKIHLQSEPRVMPCRFQKYRGSSTASRPAPSHRGSVFQPKGWIIYALDSKTDGLRFDASLAQPVARAMRGALLTQLGGNASETLSGHNGVQPAQAPHLAFVPLPFVGHYHASGLLLGIAIVPPRDLTMDDQNRLYEALGRVEKDDGSILLRLGRHGVARLVRAQTDTRSTLQDNRWSRPARRWATATPVALDRNPGNLYSREPAVIDAAVIQAEASIAEACTHIGLPEPVAVWVHRRSLLGGAPAARRFMPFPSTGNGPRRVCVHAEVLFAEPVQGPLLIGAGRFFGIGLFSPLVNRR